MRVYLITGMLLESVCVKVGGSSGLGLQLTRKYSQLEDCVVVCADVVKSDEVARMKKVRVFMNDCVSCRMFTLFNVTSLT